MATDQQHQILTIRDLHYTNGSLNLKIHDLNIFKNTNYILLGNSGSGKSCLMKILGNFISIDQKDAVHWIDELFPVYLMQNPRYQIIHEWVEKELHFPLNNLGYSLKEREKRIEKMVSNWDIAPLLHRKTRELSTGELQLLMLAVSFSMESRFLLLDEPASHLSANEQKCLGNALLRNREAGGTVIYSSQQLSDTSFADRVLLMDNGRLISEFPLAELPQHRELLVQTGLHNGDNPCR